MDCAEFLRHKIACRCCLSYPADLIDVFSSDEDIDIAKAIKEICGIDITPQHVLFNKICHECLSILRASYIFRIRSQQSDNTLHRILKGDIIVKEVLENDESVPSINEENFESDHNLPIYEEPIDEAVVDDADLKCPYCFKSFVHKKNLVIHKQRHIAVGKHTCLHCPKTFHTKFDFKRHMTSTHSSGQFFQCDKCNKKFPTKSEWNRHMQIHDEIKQFSCSECGVQFKQKANAQQHIKEMHEQRKPHFCEVCGKGFAFACKLKRHKTKNCKPFWQISIQKNDVVGESFS